MIWLQWYLTLLISSPPFCCYFPVLFVVHPFLYLFFMCWYYSAIYLQLYFLFVWCFYARNFLYFSDLQYYLYIHQWLLSPWLCICINQQLLNIYLPGISEVFQNSACSRVNLLNLLNFSSWHHNLLLLKLEIWTLFMNFFIPPLLHLHSGIYQDWVYISCISSVQTHPV